VGALWRNDWWDEPASDAFGTVQVPCKQVRCVLTRHRFIYDASQERVGLQRSRTDYCSLTGNA
jgi:hypothetical protein